MKQSTKMILFYLIVIILCGVLGFLIKNQLKNSSRENYNESKILVQEGVFKHGEEKFIEEYDIHCDEGTHIDSFYHDASGRGGAIPIEELDTLDIYCVDENGVKNGIYYKFLGDNLIQKGYFLNGEMDGERNFYIGNGVIHYKNGNRDGIETGYFSDGALRYTGAYINGKAEGQWTFYHRNGNISAIRVYSGGHQIKMEEFREDENYK